MKKNEYRKEPILVVGSNRLAFSVAVCLLQARHPVTLCTENSRHAWESINTHLTDIQHIETKQPDLSDLEITSRLTTLPHTLAIALTEENLPAKKALIRQLENGLPACATIAVNTESIPLSHLQENADHPERILGANWVEPAHTTYFLELISNEITTKDLVTNLFDRAASDWQKDPYLINGDTGIRARMISALIREAFYLVDNDSASVDDIDRACRNDAGYYLPFAGNCRYMDLMGTYAYGIVMKDLNGELATDAGISPFFQQLVDQGNTGMANRQGFYDYADGETEKWDEVFRTFSYQMQELIGKYSFQYQEENALIKNSNDH